MLTVGQIAYLNSLGITPTIVVGNSGQEIKGGDSQYDSILNDVNAVSDFRELVKNEASERVDEKISQKYPRAANFRYRAKHAEALSFKNTGYTGTSDDYQYLKKEAEQRSITMTQMADLIISATNTYNANVAAVEKRRIQFNSDLDSSTNLDQVHALWLTAQSAIEAL